MFNYPIKKIIYRNKKNIYSMKLTQTYICQLTPNPVRDSSSVNTNREIQYPRMPLGMRTNWRNLAYLRHANYDPKIFSTELASLTGCEKLNNKFN
jgi:hypothetical protein